MLQTYSTNVSINCIEKNKEFWYILQEVEKLKPFKVLRENPL